MRAPRAVKFIPFSSSFEAAFAVALNVMLTRPDAQACIPVKNADVVLVVFHASTNMKDQVPKTGRLVAALRWGEVRSEALVGNDVVHD